MAKVSDDHLQRDLLKLGFLVAALAATAAVFVVTPALSTPTLLSVLFTMLLSPLVASLERRGYPRALSITIIFVIAGLVAAVLGVWLARSLASDWESFQAKAPELFDATAARLREVEASYKKRFPVLASVRFVEALVAWGQDTGRWFLSRGPALVGEVVSWLFLVPILTFFLLKDGHSIRKHLFQLVPNRYFESAFMVTTKISDGVSDYIRAKLVEAFLVGALVGGGLAAVGAPYAAVLAVVAGVTNIVPYLGPFLGAAPGLLIPLVDPASRELLWAMAAVYATANVIDMLVIFPVFVAKMVNLHPLILIAAVVVGQHYAGLIGMLISIPIVTALKVILYEIYVALYGHFRRA